MNLNPAAGRAALRCCSRWLLCEPLGGAAALTSAIAFRGGGRKILVLFGHFCSLSRKLWLLYPACPEHKHWELLTLG